MPGRLVVAVLLLAILRPAVARADDRPFRIGARPAWFLLGGLTGGGTVAIDDRGGFLGGELSLVRLRQATYVGVYADAYYDWGVAGTYATGGLELARKIFGVDGGAALRFAGDGAELGATGRVFVSLGVLALYARYAYFDSMEDEHVIQIGATLKIPLMSPFGGGR